MSSGVLFYHPERDIYVAVHGGDFTFAGLEEDLNWIRDLIMSWYDIKERAIMGPEAGDDKDASTLGR